MLSLLRFDPLIALLHADAVAHGITDLLQIARSGPIKVQCGDVEVPQRSQRNGDLEQELELLVCPFTESITVIRSGCIRRHDEEIVAGHGGQGGPDLVVEWLGKSVLDLLVFCSCLEIADHQRGGLCCGGEH